MADVPRSLLSSANARAAAVPKGRWLLTALRWLPLGVVFCLTSFLALRSHPSLQDLPQMPRGIVRVLDTSDFLNNVAGFGVLAATLHLSAAGFARQTWSRVVRRAALVGLVAAVLECLQIWLPERSPDWRDVAAGLIGAMIASVPWFRNGRDA